MSQNKKPVFEIKEDITFIKQKVDNIDKNIIELKDTFKDIKILFDKWENNIQKINKDCEDKQKEIKSRSWFF